MVNDRYVSSKCTGNTICTKATQPFIIESLKEVFMYIGSLSVKKTFPKFFLFVSN